MLRVLNGPALVAAIATVLVTAAGCAKKDEAPPPPAPEAATAPAEVAEPLVASAKLSPRAGATASGEVVFTQKGASVAIVAHIVNAPPGTHGFHVHEVGDCSAADFTSAGGHFNPGGAIHGGPSDAVRHAGDLGNIEVGADGTAHVETSSDLLAVEEGPSSVVGRAVILHEKADDFVTQPTGAAGGRIACGVVELAEDTADAVPMAGEGAAAGGQ